MKKIVKLKRHSCKTVNSLEISERFANYIIRGNYPNLFQNWVPLITLRPKNEKKIEINCLIRAELTIRFS